MVEYIVQSLSVCGWDRDSEQVYNELGHILMEIKRKNPNFLNKKIRILRRDTIIKENILLSSSDIEGIKKQYEQQ